jgi:hypothetical protein
MGVWSIRAEADGHYRFSRRYNMTSLEYYIEQVEQFISALTDDIESGEGTVVTQTKLAVYREVLEHLEEIEQEPSYNSIKTELNGDLISRQAVLDKKELIELEDGQSFYCISPEDVETLPPVNPQPTGHWVRWYEQKENDGCIEHIPHCKCSECGKEYDPHSSQFIKYCNECGAKMAESEEV